MQCFRNISCNGQKIQSYKDGLFRQPEMQSKLYLLKHSEMSITRVFREVPY